MISRVAEHCFWMARYLERAEDTARILDVNQTLLLDYHVPMEQQWRPVLIISGIYDMPGEPQAETVQDYMTWEASNLCSIASSLAAARENARIIREVISAEMWERLNYYHLWMQGSAARQLYENSRCDFYSEIRRINQLIHGIADGTMSHDEPWSFFQLGTYLERACQTARILDVKYHMGMRGGDKVQDADATPVDNAHWVAILTSCSGYEPFHKKVRQLQDTGMAVAEFLVLDNEFPRSVRCCLRRCERAAHAVSGRPVDQPGDGVEKMLAELIGWLNGRSIAEVFRDGLHEALTHVVDSTHELGAAIHRTYFDVRGRTGSSKRGV
ncbi:MAG: alpha-E domain-containing protein [Planctomycetia bacterium]|nr:alpha-E domain-containing protein [Planctomycetia bacterium]